MHHGSVCWVETYDLSPPGFTLGSHIIGYDLGVSSIQRLLGSVAAQPGTGVLLLTHPWGKQVPVSWLAS